MTVRVTTFSDHDKRLRVDRFRLDRQQAAAFVNAILVETSPDEGERLAIVNDLVVLLVDTNDECFGKLWIHGSTRSTGKTGLARLRAAASVGVRVNEEQSPQGERDASLIHRIVLR